MRKMLVIPVSFLCMLLTACPALENQARNTAAALKGAIETAQQQHQQECTATPSGQACAIINRAVSGQNALITATEAYCGWSTASPPPDPTVTCVPVKTAQAGLQSAIANANELIAELKGVIK